jgi:HAD superfamily hydrolase (TIGR01459 family)
MPNTKFCQGISDISDSYTGFILDTWGVLHNGKELYDAVPECLKELKTRKKFVLLMTNSDRREAELVADFEKMGLPRDMYSAVLTSGEMLWKGFHDQQGVFAGLGQTCYLIGGERTRDFLGTTPITEEKDIKKAGFLLISGWDTLDKNVQVYDEVLREAVRRRIKAICIHPDSRALLGANYATGSVQIAMRFQEIGGVVTMIGKPYKPMFHECIKILHQNEIYPGQTVMIGDTMAHDILGASLVNMDTCLVRNGIHSGMFKNAATLADVNKILNALVAQYNHVRPTYLVDKLKWGKALPDRKHRRRPGAG